MTFRRIKNKKFHINKLKKRMRELRRKNKKYKRTVVKSNMDFLCLDVYEFLKDVKFGDVPVGDRIWTKAKGSAYIDIPEVFSITNNHEETIAVLKKVFYYGCNENVKSLFFDHKKCKDFEIAASTIMDSIVMACKAYRKSIGDELIIFGNFPEDLKVRKMLIASGLPAHLELKDKLLTRMDNIKLFSLAAGKRGTGRSGTVATKLTDYIDDCLETQNCELTDLGRNRISRMFSEVIDNCELHGGERTTWYTLGHFNTIQESCGEVHLVIFNYGNSIYEQLLSDETTYETREKLEYMKKRHKKEYDSNWNEETMLTVFSIQQGISRLRDKNVEGNKKRGTGTVILLDTFYGLGKSVRDLEPEFSITSGHTHIRFDKKYKLKEEALNVPVLGTGGRKIIAFNKENNLFQKADPDNVTLMKQYFPGTIISMKFYIDREYLQNLK